MQGGPLSRCQSGRRSSNAAGLAAAAATAAGRPPLPACLGHWNVGINVTCSRNQGKAWKAAARCVNCVSLSSMACCISEQSSTPPQGCAAAAAGGEASTVGTHWAGRPPRQRCLPPSCGAAPAPAGRADAVGKGRPSVASSSAACSARRARRAIPPPPHRRRGPDPAALACSFLLVACTRSAGLLPLATQLGSCWPALPCSCSPGRCSLGAPATCIIVAAARVEAIYAPCYSAGAKQAQNRGQTARGDCEPPSPLHAASPASSLSLCPSFEIACSRVWQLWAPCAPVLLNSTTRQQHSSPQACRGSCGRSS